MADTIKTNLGPVTAYADAKAHGYTGTREEFGVLLANAGLNLKAAEAAKADAEAAKQAAETAQQAAAENQKNAGTQAANAKASADTAAEQAAVAKESAADAANSATAAQKSETNAGLSATAAANAEAAAKQAQNAAETAKADAETAKTAAGNSAYAAANSAADAKKTLESIPADYSALSGKVDENANGISDLKEDLGNLSSSKISKFYATNNGKNHLADSDDGKIADMVVYGKSEQKQYSGKNLFDKSTSKSAWISDDGIYSEKGEIGESTDVASDYIGVKENSTYIASFKTNYNENRIYWCTYNANKEFVSITKSANKITVPTGIRYVRVVISMEQQYCVAVNDELQVELGTEATTYEPYTGGQPSLSPDHPQEIKSVVNPTVKVCGKNLLNPTLQTTTKNGVTCTNNGDGTYTLNGTATATDIFILHSNIDFTGQMRLCGGTSLASLQYSNSSNFAYEDKGAGIIIEHFDSVTYPNTTFNILIKTDNVYNNVLVKPMLTTDLTATYDDYEPYHEQTVTLPYTLNAIPVSSGGNVTIDGQQYIADYVNVERGKVVRIVDSSKLDNAQSIIDKTEWLLAEQQETDLTTEQTQALKKLATYYPVTNISVNSEQLDGYTVFNYPVSMENGWNYVKQQLNDNRDYIYDMDLQSAEAYVNSEYAVALTELEV